MMALVEPQPVYVVQVQRPPSNPAAVWSVVLGVVQLVCGGVAVWLLIGLWTVPLTVLAVVLGHIGLGASRRSGVGRASAWVGLVLGYAGVLNLLVLAVALAS